MKRLAWTSLVVLLLAVPSPAFADIAPPANPPGANPGPASEMTNVRMMSETVVLEVLRNAPADSLALARVTADFTMRNLGEDDETMAARFPISASDGFGRYPEIQDLKVKVGGRTVSTRRTLGPDPYAYNEESPWAEFDVSFPPAEDVPIRVTYLLEGTGELAYASFYYILSTGAGWNGTIGSADLIVRLPYEASGQNVMLDYQTGWSSTTPGGEVSGNEIRWSYTDFEPAPGEGLEVSIVRPAAWISVLTERENVVNDPNDGEAWGRLARRTKEVIYTRHEPRSDAGGQELYALSREAYETALALLPADALWHAGFADLLATHAYWARWQGDDIRPEAVRAMREIDTALRLAPNDPTVLQIAEQISAEFFDDIVRTEGGYTYPWLTATPTLPPPSTAEGAPALATPVAPTPPPATRAPLPAPPSPTPESGSGTGGGLPCGSSALAVLTGLPMLAVAGSRRRPTRIEQPPDRAECDGGGSGRPGSHT